MRHVDRRVEGAQCREMVAEMIAAADAAGYPREMARLKAALLTIVGFPENAQRIARRVLSTSAPVETTLEQELDAAEAQWLRQDATPDDDRQQRLLHHLYTILLIAGRLSAHTPD